MGINERDSSTEKACGMYWQQLGVLASIVFHVPRSPMNMFSGVHSESFISIIFCILETRSNNVNPSDLVKFV